MTNTWLDSIIGRRGFLGGSFTAMAGLGLLYLLQRDGLSAESAGWQPGVGQTHFPAKAKRLLQIFCPGAASHLDLWDYKPELFQRTGQPLPGEENLVSFQGKNGNLMAPPWEFVPCGQSGKRISSLLPRTDYLFLAGPNDQGEVVKLASGPWAQVERIAGRLMKPQDCYPPRYLVEEFPTADELQQIGIAE